MFNKYSSVYVALHQQYAIIVFTKVGIPRDLWVYVVFHWCWIKIVWCLSFAVVYLRILWLSINEIPQTSGHVTCLICRVFPRGMCIRSHQTTFIARKVIAEKQTRSDLKWHVFCTQTSRGIPTLFIDILRNPPSNRADRLHFTSKIYCILIRHVSVNPKCIHMYVLVHTTILIEYFIN